MHRRSLGSCHLRSGMRILGWEVNHEFNGGMLSQAVFDGGTGCWDVVLIRNGSVGTADRRLLWRQCAE